MRYPDDPQGVFIPLPKLTCDRHQFPDGANEGTCVLCGMICLGPTGRIMQYVTVRPTMKHQALFNLQFGWRFHGENQKSLEIVRTTLVPPANWRQVDGHLEIAGHWHGFCISTWRRLTNFEQQCFKLVEWDSPDDADTAAPDLPHFVKPTSGE